MDFMRARSRRLFFTVSIATFLGVASVRAGATAARKQREGRFWVNTESRVYHKPGSRYYGKTKKGKYMTEADARKAGYRPAARKQ